MFSCLHKLGIGDLVKPFQPYSMQEPIYKCLQCMSNCLSFSVFLINAIIILTWTLHINILSLVPVLISVDFHTFSRAMKAPVFCILTFALDG